MESIRKGLRAAYQPKAINPSSSPYLAVAPDKAPGQELPLLPAAGLGKHQVDDGSIETPSDTTSSFSPQQSEVLDPSELTLVIDNFASYSRCFTLDEVLSWLDPEAQPQVVSQSLEKDPRFIWLRTKDSESPHIIAEHALFRFFVNLNLRLARAHKTRLDSRQLGLAISSLRWGGWDSPPKEAILFAQQFGLIAQAWTPNHYVFPLARILTFAVPAFNKAPSGGKRKVKQYGTKAQDENQDPLIFVTNRSTQDFLQSLCEKETRDEVIKRPLKEWLQEGLANLDQRAINILMQREGILDGRKKTLEEIGIGLGVTRERVRQIEEKSRERLRHSSRRTLFTKAIFSYVISRQGSLIISIDSPDTTLIKFIAKCTSVPFAEVPSTGFAILGASSLDIDALQIPQHSYPELTLDIIAQHIESSNGQLSLSASDVETLASHLVTPTSKSLKKIQKVYLALKRIGKPAHYSKVTETYGLLFPEDSITEHNILALLGREKNGIVWIGLRGTYALKEWGYEQPSKGLHETVAEIVRTQYERTGKPVPFTIISAEIGKYRKIVKPSSLFFAAHFNPNLQHASDDAFIPGEPNSQLDLDISSDRLDRILREFEQNRNNIE